MATNETRSPFLELQDSQNYITMEDEELFERHLQWVQYRETPGLSPNIREMVNKIILRSALEIDVRRQEEEMLEAMIAPPSQAA